MPGNEPNRVVALRTPPGTGKTTITASVVRQVAEGGKCVWVFEPTVPLVEEMVDQIGRDVAREQRGRGSEDPKTPGQTMCRRVEDAEAVAKAGLNVRRHLCRGCPFRAGCAHLAQDAAPHRIVVMPHPYLTIPPPAAWGRPDYVAIDEGFLAQLVDVAELPLADLLACCPPPMRFPPGMPRGVFGFEDVPAFLSLAEALLSGLRDGRLLGALRAGLRLAAGGLLRSAADRAWALEKLPKVTGRTPPAELRAELARARPTARLVSLFRHLARELDVAPGRDVSHLVRLVGDKVQVSLPKPIPWLDGVPMLVLDAQADRGILERAFPGRPLTFITLDAERNADVVQVTTSASGKTRLLDNPALVRQVVGFAAGLEGRTLVVCQRPVRCSLTGEPASGRLPVSVRLPNGVEVAHYGNLRGTNRFEEFNNVVLLGRVQSRPDGVEAHSGLFWRDPEPLVLGQGYVRQDRGYCHPSGRGVSIWVHPDPRMQALVEQSREWEMVQALDRLRLFNPDPARRGMVFIFSNVPLPLPVTRLVDEEELIPEWRELATAGGGLLVKSAADLARRFPERFANAKAAENWLAGGGLSKALIYQRDSYWWARGFARHPVAVAFRPPTTRRDRPRPVREAVFTGPLQDLAAAVEAHTPGATFTASLFGGLALLTTELPPLPPEAPQSTAYPPLEFWVDCLTPKPNKEDDSCP